MKLHDTRRTHRTSALVTGLAALALAAAQAASPAAAAEQPGNTELRPFSASYAFTWHGMRAGTATFTLRQLGPGDWLYESTTEPRGLFALVPAATARVTSRMSVGPEGVRPSHFEGTEGNNRVPDAVLDFDWSALRVRGHMKDDPVDMALHEGVQDDLSVMISLMQALSHGALPSGISLFDKGGIRDYAYLREGATTLATAIGPVATDIYRSQRGGSPRHNVYWCAPQYGHVPLRAEQRRGEDLEWRMELISIERDPGP
jgi:hypothetical protein